MKLTARHRPRQLADLVGQPQARHRLRQYAGNPYPTALLFSGPTGVGKSSAALALAHELRAVDVGSLHVVESARADVEAIDWIASQFRFCPLGAWRVVIFEEADTMTARASDLCLTLLEQIPSKTTVILTTNNLDYFAKRQRFLDRLDHVPFTADPTAIVEAHQLAARIWAQEAPDQPLPDLAHLHSHWIISGQISFRRVVESLQPFLDSTRPLPSFNLDAGRASAPRDLLGQPLPKPRGRRLTCADVVIR